MDRIDVSDRKLRFVTWTCLEDLEWPNQLSETTMRYFLQKMHDWNGVIFNEMPKSTIEELRAARLQYASSGS